MFRNPRENASSILQTPTKPSTGRPPTPPPSHKMATTQIRKTASPASLTPAKPLTGSANVKRSGMSSASKIGRPNGVKANGNILSFFKKAESKAEEGLFLPDETSDISVQTYRRSPTPEDVFDGQERGGDVVDRINGSDINKVSRFNEDGQATKRRKTEADGNSCFPDYGFRDSPSEVWKNWDSENISNHQDSLDNQKESASNNYAEIILSTSTIENHLQSNPEPEVEGFKNPIPELRRGSTSYAGDDGFENLGDFDEELYPEGEEFLERQWMEEQRRFELAENGLIDDQLESLPGEREEYQAGLEQETSHSKDFGTSTECCPICSANLAGISHEDATRHVNHCLDGDPISLPSTTPELPPEDPPKDNNPLNRFKKVPRPAKPGQANPLALSAVGQAPSSAFSKLMSSHAEDEAWNSAAAAENAARGKPAYQRTCPFYKILPGFNICVDAFRYGAVEGCKAYFLSHFHSDHYVGLTATWQHGPIYCSRVTANLVRQQLRVDPKYVVDLEFEQKVDVPGSNGVVVTMIPANHCPGSSIFLFEKVMGKGKNPKTHRVLHCGDFRACPMHVHHPLLRPEIIDLATGKAAGQQRIDVCYLDTTYLNPRYAFPSQEEVIAACADMCISLKKERADENDEWEKTKRERAGSGMVKFVQRDSDSNIKDQPAGSTNDALPLDSTDSKSESKLRGRLLVIVGTYSIGKERICVGIAKALGSKIFAPAGKRNICACLEDPELDSLLTRDPTEAQVHMTPLFEIRAETLSDYLALYRSHFSRIVGFRPSGWNYRPPNSRFVESPAVQTVLHSANWKSSYSMAELVPQRGSTKEAACFGVPYSEHSSFRELTMFCCALRIDRVIPTVNIGSAKSREKMKAWVERWAADRKKNGLYRVEEGKSSW